MNPTTKEISDLFDALPSSVQTIIYDGPLDKELDDLATTYKILPADMEKLKGEVLLVVIHAKKSETLEQSISEKTSIDKSNIKKICDEIVEKIIKPLEAEWGTESHPNKDTILNEIENPVPTKPIISNPAGKNPVLDAQHNLPEGEKKVMISSAAVPSRGPLIGNVVSKPVATAAAITPVKPIFTTPTPPTQTQTPITSTPQAPVPPAPTKYTVDPYREPAE